jgi:D-3-phosphoglycerate dehydrogenase
MSDELDQKKKKIYISAYPFDCGLGHKQIKIIQACTKHSQLILKKELKEINPDGIIAGREIFDKEVFNVCPNLKVISRVGIGIDNIDLKEAKKRNIKILTTLDIPTDAVAELVIGQMINISRNISNYHKYRFKNDRIMGKCLKDLTVGIIGFGRIGKRVCEFLQPFNCKRIYANDIFDYNEFRKNGNENFWQDNIFSFESLDKVLRESDIITLHIPLNPPNNENFFNKDLLKNMKRDAFLINTSRGKVVNEDDLYEFIKNEKIAGAALDVFVNEPYQGKLKNLTNKVFCTPHIGSYTFETRKEMEINAFENCIDYLINT